MGCNWTQNYITIAHWMRVILQLHTFVHRVKLAPPVAHRVQRIPLVVSGSATSLAYRYVLGVQLPPVAHKVKLDPTNCYRLRLDHSNCTRIVTGHSVTHGLWLRHSSCTRPNINYRTTIIWKVKTYVKNENIILVPPKNKRETPTPLDWWPCRFIYLFIFETGGKRFASFH